MGNRCERPPCGLLPVGRSVGLSVRLYCSGTLTECQRWQRQHCCGLPGLPDRAETRVEVTRYFDY